MHRRGKTWMYLTADGRAYKAAVKLLLKKVKPLKGEVVVDIVWTRARKAGDIDGRLKGLLDSLNGIAWTDDKEIVDLRIRRQDKRPGLKPGLDVTVTPTGAWLSSPHNTPRHP